MSRPPWEYLFLPFNNDQFRPLFDPTWQISLVLLIVSIVVYFIRTRQLRQHVVFLDLYEWLLWTAIGVFGLLLVFALFAFDFIWVLPTLVGGALIFLWIRFIHFPPLIDAYEQRLARQRYFQRARVSHPEVTIRSRQTAPAKRKRRR